MRFHFEIKNYLQKDASCIPAINWEMIEKEKNIIFPDDYLFTEDDIMSIIEFQEKYYEGRLIR